MCPRSLRFAALTLALMSASILAQAKDVKCNIESDYDMTLNERSVIFTRDSGVPKAVVMRQGRLFVDDTWVNLSTDDSRRVDDFEKGMRHAMPLAAEIGRDAVDIAFTALGEVATGLSNNPDSTRKKLDKARREIDANLAKSINANRFSGDALGTGIERAVEDLMPTLMGDIVGGALSAALSGDSARTARLENLDKEVEARVQPRAKALEGKAEKLCRQMKELDRLDNALAYRLPNGSAMNLLEDKPDQSDTNHVE